MKRIAALVLLAIMITIPAAADTWWIPATAHADGAAGSVWRTDLIFHNFGASDEMLTITLLPQGADNSGLASTASVAVAAGNTVEVADFADSMFAFTGTAALKVDSVSSQLVVTSRTYNQGASGTFGQSIPGVNDTAVLAENERARLLGLSGTDGRRSNLGWVSADAAPITVTVELHDAAGTLLASENFPELPYGQTQLNGVFASLGTANQAAAYAVVSASGRFQPYASVVAGGSNDPIYVAAQGGLEMASELLFPAVVHADGANDTSWRSDMWLLNTGSQAANVELELWSPSKAAPTTVTLAPGEMLELADLVLNSLGLSSAQGALAVHSDQLLLATSRTYNTAPTGTFGQFIPGRTFASLGGLNETLTLPGAVQNGDFRSNLGLVATNDSTTVELVLRAADGSQLANTTETLAAKERIQKNLTTLFGVSDIAGATIEAKMTAAAGEDAALAAYISIVDNLSSDPTFGNAAAGIGEDPGIENLEENVIATTYGLAKAVDNSGIEVRLIPGAEKYVGCVDVDYSGDTIRPGESPVGMCWQAAIAFDDCSYDFALVNWSIAQNGTAAVAACYIDGYANTLDADLQTQITDHTTGDEFNYALEAALALVLQYDGSQPQSANLSGEAAVSTDVYFIEAWADLTWESNLTGFELIPVGTLKFIVPYASGNVTSTAEVTVSFDGTEWVFVQVRAGYYNTSFYLNILTGQVQPA